MDELTVTLHPAIVRAMVVLSFTVALGYAARLPVRRYTTSDGLARDSVHCIITDKDSFLWFATGEGISRFDGYEFTNYRVTDGLPDRDVRSIVQSRDSSFLIATGKGAARFNPDGQSVAGRFTVYPLPQGTKTQSVEAVLEADAAVWIGTDAGLFVVRKSTVEAFPLPSNMPAPVVTSLSLDAGGDLWVGTSAGLFAIDKELRPARVVDGPIAALLADNGAMLAGTDHGVVRARFGLKGAEPVPASGTARVRSLLRSRDGSLWIGTKDNVGQLAPGAGAVRWLGEPEGLARGDVQGLGEDSIGDVWVGYDGEGAMRISAAGFVTYDQQDGLPAGQVTSITPGRNGRPIVTTGTRPGLDAYQFENERFVPLELGVAAGYFPEPWRPWHQVLAEDDLSENGRASLWTTSHHGLLHFTMPEGSGKARLISEYSMHDGLPDDDVAHVLRDSKGNIWFSTLPIVAYPQPGSASGLGVWERKTGKIRTFSEADGLPPLSSLAILYLFEDRSGQIWIGLYQNGVARYRDGRFQVFTPAEGAPAGGIRYIYEDRLNRLWLASGRGGLGRVDDPTAEKPVIARYSIADGLASDEIQAITEDNFGRIYAGTGLGVDRIDVPAKKIVHYTKADGLAEGEVQDAMRDEAGDLWFGTYKGVSRLHPRPDPPPRALSLRISSVKVNGQIQPTSFSADQVTLADVPPGNNGVEIGFLAPATAASENVQYEYRMAGAGSAWSAPTSRRSVLYSNLRAGSYVFEARSLGRVPGPAASVRFKVLPHFWESWWFLGPAFAAFLGILFSLHRFRVANFVRIAQMRTRIARDLHDDIGSGLSKIVILSEVAQRAGTNSPVEALDRIAETSREVLNAVGDLVWATNATTEKVEDLVRRMRSFATQLFEAQDVEFALEAIDVPLQKTLSPEVLRQLYLIFKEAVNNAAKHSQCTHAQGVLQFANGTLTMQIIDNGVGLPTGMTGPQSDHHGLESLKARARILGGTIEWRCEQGTLVELIVPLRD